jgi:hypothetical protein
MNLSINLRLAISQRTQVLVLPRISKGLTTDEGEYLAEAHRCLSVNGLRACIVLGWCATVARIHAKIAEIGFDRFSKASADMNAKTTGRFKPFKKRFEVGSLSELQTVFDTDLLWVLEYMQLIDGNQHQRLRHCFEFRNNSAHPGLAKIKGENLYSFYSDISEIVLRNKSFCSREVQPNDALRFLVEGELIGICGARQASISFAEYSGTAVSSFSTEFAPGERDANKRDDGQFVGGADLKRLADRPRGSQPVWQFPREINVSGHGLESEARVVSLSGVVELKESLRVSPVYLLKISLTQDPTFESLEKCRPEIEWIVSCEQDAICAE